MLEFEIQREFKSINKIGRKFKLPNFVVLTGENGSGKSHLLEAIQSKTIKAIHENKILQNITHIPFNGLTPRSSGVEINSVMNNINNAWNTFNRYKKIYSPTNIYNGEKSNFINFLTNYNSFDLIETLEILEKLGIDHTGITKEEFRLYYKGTQHITNDIFQVNLSYLFKEYHLKRTDNDFKRYSKEELGREIKGEILTSEAFINANGKEPWIFINDVLTELGLNYEIKTPEDFSIYDNYQIKLIDKISEKEIDVNNLSTGEKVLLSLVFVVYNQKLNFKKPDLILLDEPCAPLHPSMSKKLIYIIEKYIVNDKDIPVILTTHSPSTIAVAPEESLYKLERGINKPNKIKKTQAIGILTKDISSFQLNTDDKRHIFVESPNDVKFYSEIYNALITKEELNIIPNFISANNSGGVKELIDKLSPNDNNKFYGIVDFDNKNRSTDYLLVLGEDDRYAIENYILDPLLMGLFFMKLKEIYKKDKINPKLFSLESITSFSDIKSISKEDAQKIIDYILKELELHEGDRVQYQLYNEWNLEITQTFNNLRGHTLEDLYLNKFKFLISIKDKKEEKLKLTLINQIISEYQEFVPTKLFDIIKNIC